MENLFIKFNEVEAGDACPLLLLAEIKAQIEALEDLKNKVMPFALMEFERSACGQKSYKKAGFEFSKTASGRYDYKDIPQWNETKLKLQNIEDKAKQAFKLGCMVDGIMPAFYSPNKESLTIKKSKV